MQLYFLFVLALGKAARRVVRVRGHGGSALPGVVVERLMPTFAARALAQLPDGVIVVTGTNGKTSTTKMITEVLRLSGKRVLTNPTGSNFTRGVVATIIANGRLVRPHLPYDVAVLELDEAYAAAFVKQVKPAYVVALNVLRDQLDRFGEIDHTVRLLERVMRAATAACVVNGDDPGLTKVAAGLATPVQYFGVAPALRKDFPADDEMLAQRPRAWQRPPFAVTLTRFGEDEVQYKAGDETHTATLALRGQHNFLNAAACLALCRLVLPKTPTATLVERLAKVRPAFGRGETITIAGRPLDIVLVKNPAGFRQALKSFGSPAEVMIAINDNYADGRDVSWLWDVDFSSLKGKSVMTSGSRALDMATRLQYDNVAAHAADSDIKSALDTFLQRSGDLPFRIFCTYTAMLAIRARLAKYTEVKKEL